MSGSSFGKIYKLHTFGESHGKAIGGIIDGCPSGIELDLDEIQHELDRRKPGQSSITTQRKESDTVEFLSGIMNGKTLGTPIGFIIPNQDSNSSDYDHLKNTYRPGHADYTYDKKYGVRDHRGGGRSSARETTCRVVAGAIAKQILNKKGISINAWVNRIHNIEMKTEYQYVDLSEIDKNIVRCPDKETSAKMILEIERARDNGNSLGGTIFCLVKGCPVGIGEPVFDKLNAVLAKAMMSINAVKSFEIGSGIKGTYMKGTEHNDLLSNDGEFTKFESNNSGGILGGISNGDDIYFQTGFKPVSTIMSDQTTIDSKGKSVILQGKGRHDPCVLPRAVPIVEAMAAISILDLLLIQTSKNI